MTRRVLTVDDSKTMREMVAYTLRTAGFTVNEAEDGQQALSVLRANPIDLIITDLNMPKMDGVTFIRHVRAEPKYKGLPILMLTTEGDANKKAEGRSAGATGWLVKPFDPEKLIEVAQRVCA